MIKSIYVHIPFCKSLCTYCDFCKLKYNKEFVSLYLEKLKKEVAIYKDKIGLVETLYIGGGSPSSLSKEERNNLFKIIDFKFKTNYEFTFELMVKDISKELLIDLKNRGVNRVSIGIEKVNCKSLNRNISETSLIEKINLVKKYFTNFNLDLMYGFSGQTMTDLDSDLNFILKFNPPHISSYHLILENNTILKNKGYKEIDEDKSLEFYNYIRKKLRKYNHYEISNFAKKGYESRHNLVYWHNEEYLGLGLGASSYLEGIRFKNTRSLNNYPLIIEKEVLSKNDMMCYYMILGLRLKEGVSFSYFKKVFHKEIEEVYNISDLIKSNVLIKRGDDLKVNPKYWFQENNILERFIDE